MPRSCHTNIVDHLLALNHSSIREQIHVRYIGFFDKLRKSKATPVKFLVNIVARDVRSTTARNLKLIEEETGQNPWKTNKIKVQAKLQRKPVPAEDNWRVPLLYQFLSRRHELEANLENTDCINSLIDSLCSS